MPDLLMNASTSFAGAVQSAKSLEENETYRWSEGEFFEAKKLYEFIRDYK